MIALVQELIGIGIQRIPIGSELGSSFIYPVQGNLYVAGFLLSEIWICTFPFL